MKLSGLIIAGALLLSPAISSAHEVNSGEEAKAPIQKEATTTNKKSDKTIKHSGGTDSMGCHTNRKTGWYHCH